MSVDPGKLDPIVTAMKNVEYFPAKAEDVVGALRARGPYSVIACDANDTGASRLVLPVLDLLLPGGLLVLTIKAPNKFVNRAQIQAVCDPLEKALPTGSDGNSAWESINVHWLLANTDRERVVVARRRADSAMGHHGKGNAAQTTYLHTNGTKLVTTSTVVTNSENVLPC